MAERQGRKRERDVERWRSEMKRERGTKERNVRSEEEEEVAAVSDDREEEVGEAGPRAGLYVYTTHRTPFILYFAPTRNTG